MAIVVIGYFIFGIGKRQGVDGGEDH